MNNSIWTPNSSGSLANGETGYDSSTRIDQKRSHEWFIDTTEQDLFFNKKQAIESVETTPGAAVSNDTLGCDSSNSQSGGQIGDRLFSPKPVRYVNVSGNNVPSTDTSVQKNGLEEQFGNDTAICLSIPQAAEAPFYLNTGLRKVKVNEVRISENCLPEFIGNYSNAGEKNKAMSSTSQITGHDIFPGSAYNTAAAGTMSGASALSMIEKDYISVGPESSKQNGNLMLANQFYDGISNTLLSAGQYFNGGNYNTNTITEQYPKENGGIIPVGPTYSRGPESLFTMDPFYNKMNNTFLSAGSTYNKGPADIMSITSIQAQQDTSAVPLGTLYNRENSSILSMGLNTKKGEQTTISFGGIQDNLEASDPSGGLITSYGNLLNQSSAQSSGTSGLTEALQQLSENVAATSTDGANKNKDHKGNKKAATNNFPTNVKSLLSTGILDGVPVKYVSWSREKNLRGVVKGTGYLCSCQECKLSKVINAYEFERHAGCKTKHPNNHIYFENGKTIYAVVQELKGTPQEMLFDVIQNVTGSPINQKNFHVWKASFQAATRELRRIYGREEVVVPSC